MVLEENIQKQQGDNTMKKTSKKPNIFLMRTVENPELNQYWYSANTITMLVKEIEEVGTKVAFLSTPSLYFSLTNGDLKKTSFVFDIDTQWKRNQNFVKWDFNKPSDIPEDMCHAFDLIVIDPPFITREVWTRYTEATKLLLTPGGKIILSTIGENAEMLKELLNVKPQLFEPSIPHLVYQYTLYTNYESNHLSQHNPEFVDS